MSSRHGTLKKKINQVYDIDAQENLTSFINYKQGVAHCPLTVLFNFKSTLLVRYLL